MINDFFIYFLFVVSGYIIGLLPFEHLVGRFKDDDKDYNWRNAAIFSLSLLKGFLAVFLPFLFGAPLQVQAFCGIASIIGQSWSPFLSFKEEKIFPVLIGALILLYLPTVLIMCLVCLIFSMLWSASVAIMISILLGVMMSFANIDLWSSFSLLFCALVILILKRLLPLNAIFPLKERKDLIENRIFFDQDNVPLFKVKMRKKTNAISEGNHLAEVNSYNKDTLLSIKDNGIKPKKKPIPKIPKKRIAKTTISKTKKVLQNKKTSKKTSKIKSTIAKKVRKPQIKKARDRKKLEK